MSTDKPLVIYNQRMRWVAALNMTFVAVGIWLALRFGSGISLYLPVLFLGFFSLFWIRDLLFGFRLKLLCDGRTLHWQEGKKLGSIALAEIREVRIGVGKPVQCGDGPVLQSTHVRFALRSGAEEALPPNIAQGLRSRKWRHLKRLLSHMRTVAHVVVKPISDPDVTAEGWEDDGPANTSQPIRSETDSTASAAGSRR